MSLSSAFFLRKWGTKSFFLFCWCEGVGQQAYDEIVDFFVAVRPSSHIGRFRGLSSRSLASVDVIQLCHCGQRNKKSFDAMEEMMTLFTKIWFLSA